MSIRKQIEAVNNYFLVFQARSSWCTVLLGMIFMTKNADGVTENLRGKGVTFGGCASVG